ncbi:MAG: isoaspartyl peptidase/L-asparaginase [Weeksellaceae bacterium]|nr:isoaspartyl peptidase/L-asparaginase [Weeksellaceae bacterium]
MRLFLQLIFLMIMVGVAGQEHKKYVAVVHGGAGWIQRENTNKDQETAYHQAITQALQLAYQAIKSGKPAEEAVVAAVIALENSPLFNAGVGAVITYDGTHQLDASIMTGKNRAAGAVAGVMTVKNPVLAAQAVMNNSSHVLLSGRGAEQFATQQGLEMVENTHFTTPAMKQKWENSKKESSSLSKQDLPEKLGTVGAVALDSDGHIAAATSTGGMMMKRWDRVGDSPIIGAGTYASDIVGVSSTGWGEFYLKTVAAYDVHARMQYANAGVQEACAAVLSEIKKLGGNGGIIALTHDGKVSMDFNTPGMFRGAVAENGEIEVYFYGDEPR